jgi:hypothetical protein
MSSNWRLAARRAIQQTIASFPPDCDRAELKKAIDAAYPFGERAYHPYKIWLSERREIFIELGIISKPPAKIPKSKKKRKKPTVSPGQLNLFDEVNIDFNKNVTD